MAAHSLSQCFGSAAVPGRDCGRANYSIVLRRNGQFNGRDPENTGCGAASRSPYETRQQFEQYRLQSTTGDLN